jgi:hypothetical protein
MLAENSTSPSFFVALEEKSPWLVLEDLLNQHVRVSPVVFLTLSIFLLVRVRA